MSGVRYQVGAGADARSIEGCKACAIVWQVVLNLALLADLALNTACLGMPTETLSQRAARARRAGSKPAAAFCAALAWVWKHILRSEEPDHCRWALEGPGSIGREVWHWSLDEPNPPPPPDAR